MWMWRLLQRVGGYHHHRRRRRHHHLLLFFVSLPFPAVTLPLAVSLRSSQEEHGSQAGDPSVHTLATEQTPSQPVFSDTPPLPPPDTSLPPRSFPPSRRQSPRCILNQSLGGNAITRHHDASTIFYFKLLYVLVPPAVSLSSPPRRLSFLVDGTQPSSSRCLPLRYVNARHTPGFAGVALLSRILSRPLPPSAHSSRRRSTAAIPPPPSLLLLPQHGLVTRLFY